MIISQYSFQAVENVSKASTLDPRRRCYRKHVKTTQLGVGIRILDMACLGTVFPSLKPSTRNLARQRHDAGGRPNLFKLLASASWLVRVV
jgi:hypothetical protein